MCQYRFLFFISYFCCLERYMTSLGILFVEGFAVIWSRWCLRPNCYFVYCHLQCQIDRYRSYNNEWNEWSTFSTRYNVCTGTVWKVRKMQPHQTLRMLTKRHWLQHSFMALIRHEASALHISLTCMSFHFIPECRKSSKLTSLSPTSTQFNIQYAFYADLYEFTLSIWNCYIFQSSSYCQCQFMMLIYVLYTKVQ